MRRLLRNKRTQEYFGSNGVWSKDFRTAQHYRDISALIKAADQFKGIELQEVLIFGETPSEYDVALDLITRPKRPEA